MSTKPTPASQPSPAPDAYAVYFVRRGSGTEDRLLVDREEDAKQQVEAGLIRRVVPLFAAQESAPSSEMSKAEIDEIVYQCRQSGKDTTYDIVNAALARRATEAPEKPE